MNLGVYPEPSELAAEYELRFAESAASRRAVWRALIDGFFGCLIDASETVLDLGAGWGEFINQVPAQHRYAMDLNSATRGKLDEGVTLLEQDCSATWPLPDGSLDVVFTSNFFEHLCDKPALSRTLTEVTRCLRPGGRLICMGPNARLVPGAYWDFFDHHLPLTDLSLCEAVRLAGLRVDRSESRFLPYTMADKKTPPAFTIRLYLALPWAWRIMGKQFLVIGSKPEAAALTDPRGVQRIAA